MIEFAIMWLGVLGLWASGVGFIMAVRAWRGDMSDTALADVLGWPVTLLPWREWTGRSSSGRHRLVAS